MRIKRSGPAGLNVTAVLSRRNLLVLLAKLGGNPPNSACAIYKDGVIVKAEEDATHYAGVTPGVMHPDTEKALGSSTE